MRRATQYCLVGFDGVDQQVRIIGPPRVDFVVDHDLVFRFLQFDHLAEFVGLAALLGPSTRRRVSALSRLSVSHNDLSANRIGVHRIKSFCIAKPMQKLCWTERRPRRERLWNFQARI